MRTPLSLIALALISMNALAQEDVFKQFPNALVKPKATINAAEVMAEKEPSKINLPDLSMNQSHPSLPKMMGEMDDERLGAQIDTPDKRLSRLYVAAVMGDQAVLKSAPFIPGMAGNSAAGGMAGGGMGGASGGMGSMGASSGKQQVHSPMTNMKTYTYRVKNGQTFHFFGDWELKAVVKNGEVTLLKDGSKGKNKVVFFGTVDSADYKFAHVPEEMEKSDDSYVKKVQDVRNSTGTTSSTTSGSGATGGAR